MDTEASAGHTPKTVQRARLVIFNVAWLLLVVACAGRSDPATGEPLSTTTTETNEVDDETGDAANGATVFASAGCDHCHTLEAAGSIGRIGPNLDDSSPSFDDVVASVTNGGDRMPVFGDELSEQEIRDVAAFVTDS